jgi:hypothetical protein
VAEVGNRKLGRLTRADVVKRPGPHDRQAAAQVAVRGQVRRGLGGGVGAVGPQLRQLVERLHPRPRAAVNHARPDVQDARLDRQLGQRIVEVERAQQIDLPGGPRVSQRLGDIGQPRQMIDDTRG